MNNLENYLLIAGKSITIYLFIILAIRVFGKKELAQLSIIDLVFILLISNSVQNAMVGPDNTLVGGMSAALGLFVANYIFKYLSKRFKKFSNFVQGEKILLVSEGKIIKKGLDEAMMSVEELERAVREHGVETIDKVDLAILEIDGNISILSENFKHKSAKLRHKPQLSHNP